MYQLFFLSHVRRKRFLSIHWRVEIRRKWYFAGIRRIYIIYQALYSPKLSQTSNSVGFLIVGHLTNIYIYISICIYIHVYIYICIYIYIYIYQGITSLLWEYFANNSMSESPEDCISHNTSSLFRCLAHWGRDKIAAFFADDILKCIFLNGNSWIPNEISWKYVA